MCRSFIKDFLNAKTNMSWKQSIKTPQPHSVIFLVQSRQTRAQYLLENRVRASVRRFCCSLWCLCWLADLVIWCVKLTRLNVAPILWLFAVLLCQELECEGISTPSSEIWTSYAREQRLQQGAYVLCALHLKVLPPLNNVDIPLPRATSIWDGSQANDCPPSFLPSQQRSPISHPQHRELFFISEKQSDPEQWLH